MEVTPILERRFRFERAVCDVRVTQHRTSQGEEMFRAAAFEVAAAADDQRPVTGEDGGHFEALALTPSEAAEQVADALERRFGRRLTEPDEMAPPGTTPSA
jgi:hypothetical protein